MTNKIHLERQADGIAVLTFNRPEVLNALDLAMMYRFAECIAELQGDADLRALILAGAGSTAFCSGGDLVELSHYPTEADGLSFITMRHCWSSAVCFHHFGRRRRIFRR